jgi:ABC-type spermidine/putrescine transport system permease subunit I
MTDVLVDGRGRAVTPAPARRRRDAFVLDAPVVRLLALLVGVSAAIPLGYLIVRVWELGWTDTVAIATSARTRTVLIDTIVLAVAVTAAALAISLPLAWLTTRTDLPARRTWVVLTALPLAIPTYVGAFAMIGALGPRGILQGWLEPLGVDRLPSIYGFGGAFVVLTLFTYPYLLLTIRAAYNRLDPSLEEASRTLGRNSLVTFLRVVVPQLKPAIAAGSLLVALYVLSDFGAVSMLRYDTFTRAIYVQYRGGLDRGSAAVMGLMLVVLTVAVLAAEQRLRGSESLHRLHGSGARAAATLRLGPWRWVAAGACSVLVIVALVVPLSVIGYWLWRGTRVGESWFPAWSLVANSLWASALGALLTVACAWPVAMLAVRSPGRSSRSRGTAVVVGIRAARHRRRAGARVLRRQLRSMGLPDDGHAGVRLHGVVPPAGDRCDPVLTAAGHTVGRGSVAPARLGIVHHVPPGDPASDATRGDRRRRPGLPHLHEGTARDPPARPHRVRNSGDAGLDGVERSVPGPRRRACDGARGAVVAPDDRARATRTTRRDRR